MYKHSTNTAQPPRQATPATPPQEGNVPPLRFNVPPLRFVDTFSTVPRDNHAMERFYILYLFEVMHNVTPLVLLQQVAVLFRLPPLHRRGMVHPYTGRLHCGSIFKQLRVTVRAMPCGKLTAHSHRHNAVGLYPTHSIAQHQ